jgi:hypothetical protein
MAVTEKSVKKGSIGRTFDVGLMGNIFVINDVENVDITKQRRKNKKRRATICSFRVESEMWNLET